MDYEVNCEMGASVGIGGLIIGTTMLVVFSMVVASIDAKVDTSLQTIDSATEALPVFTIDDATLWEGAVVDVQIGSGGSGYVNGTLVSSTGNGGFIGTFTVNGAGAITAVAITSHGNYSSAPTIVIQGQTPTSSASFVVSIGNFIHSNVTNTGSYITPLREAWLFSDGANPTNLGTVFRTGTNNPHWYSGETLHIQWDESGTLPVERFALSVRGVNMASSLA
jgi:hypothetical protein